MTAQRPRKAKLKKVPKQYGGTVLVLQTADGKRHRILNADLPKTRDGQLLGELYTGVCEVCGHLYSELITLNAKGLRVCVCSECLGDAIMQRAIRHQRRDGVYLGVHDNCSGDVESEHDSRERLLFDRGRHISREEWEMFGIRRKR